MQQLAQFVGCIIPLLHALLYKLVVNPKPNSDVNFDVKICVQSG